MRIKPVNTNILFQDYNDHIFENPEIQAYFQNSGSNYDASNNQKYRRKIIIRNISGKNLENVQVPITINESVHKLKEKTLLKYMLFVDEKNEIINYFIEEFSTHTTSNKIKIQLKIPNIQSDETCKITQFYGGKFETSYNPNDVFVFYDDFDYFDESKQTVLPDDEESFRVRNGFLELQGHIYIQSIQTFQNNLGFVSKALATDQDINFLRLIYNEENCYEIGNSDAQNPNDYELIRLRVYKSGSAHDYQKSLADFRFCQNFYKIERLENYNVRAYQNDILVGNVTSNNIEEELKIQFNVQDKVNRPAVLCVDYVYVYKLPLEYDIDISEEEILS